MQPTASSTRIVVLGMGGTIAGVAADAADNLGYVAGVRGVDELVTGIAPAGLTIETESVAQINSKDLVWDEVRHLVSRIAHHIARPEVAGVVVTHGTDTLEETAYLLHRTVSGAKPVVLTGAMRPATSAQADGPQNLRDAFAAARDAHARGVLVAFAGRVHAGSVVRKVHPYRLDAFGSGEAGALGVVEEGTVRWWRDPTADASPVDPRAVVKATEWPWVEIVTSAAGADPRSIEALVAAGVQGIVIAATGNGQVHRALEPALDAAVAAGVDVWRATRCGDGRIIDAPHEPPAGDPTALWPSAGALTPVQARLELALKRLVRA